MINAAMLLEEVVERVANHLGKDPVAIRELNFHKQPSTAQSSSVAGSTGDFGSLSNQRFIEH